MFLEIIPQKAHQNILWTSKRKEKIPSRQNNSRQNWGRRNRSRCYQKFQCRVHSLMYSRWLLKALYPARVCSWKWMCVNFLKIIMLLKIDISLQAGCQESSKLVAIKTARQSSFMVASQVSVSFYKRRSVMNMHTVRLELSWWLA